MHCKDVSLEPGNSGTVDCPCTIRSGGLGPCIAIGIFNKVSRKGYMVHLEGPGSTNAADDFLTWVLSENEIEDIKVYVTGGIHDDDADTEMRQQTTTDRWSVQRDLTARLPNAQIVIKWGKRNSTAELVLDTETGKFTVEY